ncbi:DUF742 domain-containing protein [Streptomyces chrestomyceticus]|uniref:DUF742 domain-containing protein n=1 Tax=Streptomyces chrestomyceticus TaxID=68185 RepID=UPI0033C9EB1E
MPDRWFVITGGRTRPDHALDAITLVVTERGDTAGLQGEEARIIALCHRPLAVAEIAARLEAPLGVTKVLISRLLDEHRVHTRAPALTAASDDKARLCERVLRGLQKL